MELEYRVIDLKDKEWITELLKVSDFMGCEYSFANNFAWRRLSDSEICRYKNFYFLKSVIENDAYYTYPAGDGDIAELIDLLLKECKREGRGLRLVSVLEDCVEKLKSIYGDKADAEEDRDNFDYIYNTQELIELRGKKFHGKRNHITNFKKADWEYKELTNELIDDCIEFSAVSFNEKESYTSHSAVAEQFAINMFFSYYDTLGLKGGVLYQNGRMVGFTFGEELNSETFVIHVEKALPDVQGAYPTLFNEFIKANASSYKYINREDDVGIEGLRKSKLSYRPEFLLKKYVVTFKDM